MLVMSMRISLASAQWIRTGGPVGSTTNYCLAANDTIILSGTSGKGVFLSTDNGETWTSVNNGLTSNYISSIAINSTHIIVGTAGAVSNGIFLSTDNAKSWTTSFNSGNPTVDVIYAVNDTIVLAGVSLGLQRSTDNGATWATVNSSPAGVDGFAISGTDLFAGTRGSKIYRSTDDGLTWGDASSGLPGFGQIGAVGVCGNNIFAGVYTEGIYRSTDNGGSWVSANAGLTNLNVRALVTKGSNIFAATEGGVFLSSDSGATWSAVRSGLTDTLVYSLATNGDQLFAGTFSFVYRLPLSYFNPLSAPVLSFPQNGSLNQALSPVLKWMADTNAFTYHLQLAKDSAFTLIVYDNSTIKTDSSLVGILARNTSYYWKVKSLNLAGSSPWSPTWHFITHDVFPVNLLSPANDSVNQSVLPTLSWSASAYASAYRLQVGMDSGFSSSVFDDSTIAGTSKEVGPLVSDTDYYWRVMTLDSGNTSAWSPIWRFRTLVIPPSNVTASAGNKKMIISWAASPSSGVMKYKIYRAPTSPASIILDSTVATSYIDSELTNGAKYFYRITSENSHYLEGPPSLEVSGTPFNQLPHAVSLPNIYEPNAGNVQLETLNFSSAGSRDSDGTVDSIFWFVNGSLVSKEPLLSYSFGQGTNQVMLVVEDNQGARDTSIATVNRSKFKFSLNGPVYAGPSMLGNDILYVIGTGDAVYRLDSAGNALYSLQVGGDVKSSSSIAYDTTVYIASSDKNLYAFSRSGNAAWPALPLGGILASTPTVDSAANVLYLGVSNKNFVAVNRSAGIVSWSYFADAPIVGSAAITLDRKLVFAAVTGTVYGFDLSNLSSSLSPTWQLSLSDSILGSPAVDGAGFIYYCTSGGKVVKISLPSGQPANVEWTAQTGGQAVSSPVIDGYGTLYVGASDGKLYSIETQDGKIKWTYATAAPIYSTPAVSSVNMIYVGNHAGRVCAIDTGAILHWYYQDSTGADAPLLYHNGTLYVGTTGGRLVAFYDNADSSLTGMAKASQPKKISAARAIPVWGTFQGNNQRTGLPVGNGIAGIRNFNSELPKDYRLYQNYPNPFNPTTTINYDVPKSSRVTLVIYDVLGRQVEELANGEKTPGRYQVTFYASGLTSGVYLCRLEAGTYHDTKKLLLLK